MTFRGIALCVIFRRRVWYLPLKRDACVISWTSWWRSDALWCWWATRERARQCWSRTSWCACLTTTLSPTCLSTSTQPRKCCKESWKSRWRRKLEETSGLPEAKGKLPWYATRKSFDEMNQSTGVICCMVHIIKIRIASCPSSSQMWEVRWVSALECFCDGVEDVMHKMQLLQSLLLIVNIWFWLRLRNSVLFFVFLVFFTCFSSEFCCNKILSAIQLASSLSMPLGFNWNVPCSISTDAVFKRELFWDHMFFCLCIRKGGNKQTKDQIHNGSKSWLSHSFCCSRHMIFLNKRHVLAEDLEYLDGVEGCASGSLCCRQGHPC